MKPEEQRIAIAEACGWKDFDIAWDNIPIGVPPHNHHLSVLVGQRMVPDYVNDLNAMHEAEKVLTESQHAVYFEWLTVTNGFPEGTLSDLNEHECMKLLNSTAAQRAEAFLKTLGLWKDE